ncbi:hypothetical protein LJR034_004715 [Caballeronia sp. LjRoot34]|uniref:hypothetical protein n=1 Tax=Caballeronia sp. LjRoot34 TaxID=3342325 RepID=UPI003ECD3027
MEMTALLASIWPYIFSGVLAAGGILFGWLKTKQAQTTVAQAGQKVAEAQTSAAQAQTQTAEVRDAEAQANAAASAAGVQAIKERTNAENDVTALPVGAADQQLRDDWSRAGEDAGHGAGGAGKDPNR